MFGSGSGSFNNEQLRKYLKNTSVDCPSLTVYFKSDHLVYTTSCENKDTKEAKEAFKLIYQYYPINNNFYLFL